MVVYFTVDCQSDRFVVADNGLRTGIWIPLDRKELDWHHNGHLRTDTYNAQPLMGKD